MGNEKFDSSGRLIIKTQGHPDGTIMLVLPKRMIGALGSNLKWVKVQIKIRKSEPMRPFEIVVARALPKEGAKRKVWHMGPSTLVPLPGGSVEPIVEKGLYYRVAPVGKTLVYTRIDD